MKISFYISLADSPRPISCGTSGRMLRLFTFLNTKASLIAPRQTDYIVKLTEYGFHCFLFDLIYSLINQFNICIKIGSTGRSVLIELENVYWFLIENIVLRVSMLIVTACVNWMEEYFPSVSTLSLHIEKRSSVTYWKKPQQLKASTFRSFRFQLKIFPFEREIVGSFDINTSWNSF